MDYNFKSLEEFIKKYKTNEPSFLEVINRGNDENLVSLYLSFLFKENIGFLNNIIDSAYGTKIDNIVDISVEKTTYSNKRIDIFIEGKNEDNNVYIVIENKIWSAEHDNQCNEYYNFVENEYENGDKYYLYLCPSSNKPLKLSNSHFNIITYDDVLDALESQETLSKFELDFKTLINNRLRGNNMNELDIFLINNRQVILDELDSIKKDMDSLIMQIQAEYMNHQSNLKTELINDKTNLRFYYHDGNENWWSDYKDDKADQYYFYIEISVKTNFSIFSYRTIKNYDRNNDSSKLTRFFKSNKECKNPHTVYFVMDRKDFKSDKQILSNEWKAELKQWVFDTFDEYLPKHHELFKQFLEFK